MVATAEIRASGAYVTSLTGTSNAIMASQAFVRVLYNIPTIGVQASSAYVTTLMQTSNEIRSSAAYVTVLWRGRVAQPQLRAWTYTMDGHDFYVLRLGDFTTLVYDTFSKQWSEWRGADLPFWRANTGMNWIGGQKFATDYGSNVVVGDDTWGLLWFLDPLLPYDEAPDSEAPAQQIPFDRVVSGQVTLRGRDSVPCYGIFLAGDNYGLTATDFTPGVTLETSDDDARTFDNQGMITVPADYEQQDPYEWLSLGLMSSPGRIFRITDNGVFTRIDGMDMNDNAG